MAYEYESDIKSLIIDNPADIDGYYAYDELEEVYKKAKVFNEILRHAKDDYKAPETKVELIIETIGYYMEDEYYDV